MLGTTISGFFRRTVSGHGGMKNNSGVRFRSTLSMLLPILAFVATQSAQGALLGPDPVGYPDITSSSIINYNYTGSGGTLTITGNFSGNTSSQTIKMSAADIGSVRMVCASNVVASGCNPSVSKTTYSLSANFDASGNFLNGTVSVGGYVNGVTGYGGYQPYVGLANSGTLLTASLGALGFYAAPTTTIHPTSTTTTTYNQLKLVFTGALTGGDFNNGSYGFGGVIWNGPVNSGGAPISTTTPFTQSFSSCSGSTGCAQPTLDTVVPLPAAAWLLGSGLAGLLGVAGRRRDVRAA